MSAAPVPWSRRLLVGAAIAYPCALILLAALLRFVGERWWVSTALLYLPRQPLALPLPLLAFLLWRRDHRWLLRLQLVSVVVLVFPLLGFVLPWPAGGTPGHSVVRVLSYNANHGYGGPARLVEEIDRHQPDVVLLQKLGENQEAVMGLLRARYPVVDFPAGFLVASRFPLVSRHLPPSFPAAGKEGEPRYTQWVLATPFGPVAFYGIHPASPREGLAALAHPARAAEVIRRETALRTRQVEAIVARAAAETIPVVLAGDTNLAGLSPLLARAFARYQDGFSAASWGFGYTYPTDKLVPWMRIDRILATPSLRFVRFTVGTSKVSDHRCVVADLQLR